ncbi:MAG: hypothetical protein DRP37_04265 [Thermodesulfobacteriota bacterium]|nr:MAG: hypothetical protein DRP37_04265 [Thermodesulfobacteriota bacterium]
MKIERFENIEAWQLARELTGRVYGLNFRMYIDHAGRTRAAIRGFIKYLLAYEQGRRNKNNPEPVNL